MREKIKTERLETRTTKKDKLLIAKAANLKGMTTSQFVLSVARDKAFDVISESEQVLKSQKDKEIFVEALINPPAPNQELKTAFKEFKRTYAKASKEEND